LAGQIADGEARMRLNALEERMHSQDCG
jgi:hypothetical protein